jgi:hypothetical protein
VLRFGLFHTTQPYRRTTDDHRQLHHLSGHDLLCAAGTSHSTSLRFAYLILAKEEWHAKGVLQVATFASAQRCSTPAYFTGHLTQSRF